METGLEVVKVVVTFSVSFLLALAAGRLCLSAIFQGFLSATPMTKASQDLRKLNPPSDSHPTV